MKKDNIIKELKSLGVDFDETLKSSELKAILDEEKYNVSMENDLKPTPVEEPKEGEDTGIQAVEEPKPEPIKEPKPKAKKEKRKPDFVVVGTFGREKVRVVKLGKRIINGNEYNEIHTIDGCTYLLNDEEFNTSYRSKK